MTEAEALAELKSFPVNCLDFREQMALDMAIEAMEKQEVAKEYGKDTNVRSNGWIPVTDHLPSDIIGRYYLTTEKGYYEVSISYFSVADKKWYTDSDCRVPVNIVAWMEMLAPYQKGE